MDSKTLENLLNLLNSICHETWSKLVFLLNNRGELIAYVGDSPAFKGNNKTHPPPLPDDEGENLYFTQLKCGLYIGLLFPDSISFASIRSKIQDRESNFETTLKPYLST